MPKRIDVHVEGLTVNRSGTVVRLSPSIEAANRSLLVEAEIPNPDNVLRAGSFAEGIIASVQAGLPITINAIKKKHSRI